MGKSNATDNAILNYNLFGETGDLPDVVHCETIETRSQLHNWELAAHRHARLHQVLLLETGRGETSLDGVHKIIKPKTFINIPIGIVHEFSFKPGTTGLVITIAAEVFHLVLQASHGLQKVLASPAVLPADKQCIQTMKAINSTFLKRDFARAHILRAHSSLLLGLIARQIAHNSATTEPTAQSNLFTEFTILLDQHYTEHWTVSDYAKVLNISTTHLTRLTRATTGQPTTRLIEERIVLEARRNLVYTNLPIATIAYQLGYNDPAYFSRVFTRATGAAPKEFRLRVLDAG